MTRRRTPVEHRFAGADGSLCWFEWGSARADQSSVALLHATGFHARCWDAVVDALPADSHVIALDLPGHGRSFAPATMADWGRTAALIAEWADAVLEQPYVGAGHSMGGHMLLRVAAMAPSRLRHAILVDPVIMDPAIYAAAPDSFVDPVDHPVARRRDDWPDAEAMIAHFSGRSPYSLWSPDVLADYCRYGLTAKGQGDGYRLACAPATEVSVYTSAARNSPLELLDAVTCPVTVVRARRAERESMLDFTSSPTWPQLADGLPMGVDMAWDDLTHFIPMQDPGRIAGLIASVMSTEKQG